MSQVQGGLTMEQLIQAAWDSTPEGGSSTWIPREEGYGSGDWVGKIYCGETDSCSGGYGWIKANGSYSAVLFN